METSRSPPSLSWSYYYQGKSMEELRQALFCATLELETTRLTAQEEIQRRETLVIQLKDILTTAMSERDEAQEKCQRLLIDKLILLQQVEQLQNQTTPHSGISSIDDETKRCTGGGDSNSNTNISDCEESIVSSPIPQPPLILVPEVIPEKPLPEKGNLLQAVMKAGPLLQTLLLAGPLPQWRHPPPPLDSFEIPPVAIPSPSPPPSESHFLHHQGSQSQMEINRNNCYESFNTKKRNLLVFDGSDSCTNSIKYQRVLLH